MAIALAFKEPKRLARELDEYMQTKAFLLMLFGLCLVLVFGRVFGTGSFWAVILPSSEISVVKNIVQEGIEFLGYTMCLISAIVFNTKNLNFKGKE
ncbi:hypothetical protein LMG8286_01542 [Campylobacter suis]|uniref:Uncharacterized protein n=2 Tax=Campylobacter suis TaxID=2790657 RepID=A0ABM8Q785_9BACT|nr:hypothetical protein LMG8286_01542 [Campylobacter suis]